MTRIFSQRDSNSLTWVHPNKLSADSFPPVQGLPIFEPVSMYLDGSGTDQNQRKVTTKFARQQFPSSPADVSGSDDTSTVGISGQRRQTVAKQQRKPDGNYLQQRCSFSYNERIDLERRTNSERSSRLRENSAPLRREIPPVGQAPNLREPISNIERIPSPGTPQVPEFWTERAADMKHRLRCAILSQAPMSFIRIRHSSAGMENHRALAGSSLASFRS